MSGQRKKDLAKENKKHGYVGKKDTQGGLLSRKFKEEFQQRQSAKCCREVNELRMAELPLAIRSHWWRCLTRCEQYVGEAEAKFYSIEEGVRRGMRRQCRQIIKRLGLWRGKSHWGHLGRWHGWRGVPSLVFSSLLSPLTFLLPAFKMRHTWVNV